MKNDPSFPIIVPGLWNPVENKGLTKRELIAAMAMQGMFSIEHSTTSAQSTHSIKWNAQAAVKAADALIAELEKKDA